jgi:hypothetical protein
MPDGMRIQDAPRGSLEEPDQQYLDRAIFMFRLNPPLIAALFFVAAGLG